MTSVFLDKKWTILLIVSIIGFVLPILNDFVYRETKGLTSYIISNVPVVDVNDLQYDDLEILHLGKPLKKLSVLSIGIRNSGTMPIAKDDFETPLKIILEGQAIPIKVKVTDSKPNDLNLSLILKTNEIVIQPTLWNNEDHAVIEALVTGELSGIHLTGRVKGVKELTIQGNIKEEKGVPYHALLSVVLVHIVWGYVFVILVLLLLNKISFRAPILEMFLILIVVMLSSRIAMKIVFEYMDLSRNESMLLLAVSFLSAFLGAALAMYRYYNGFYNKRSLEGEN